MKAALILAIVAIPANAWLLPAPSRASGTSSGTTGAGRARSGSTRSACALLLAVFYEQPRFAQAGWLALGLGDGLAPFIALVVSGPAWPWNPRKRVARQRRSPGLVAGASRRCRSCRCPAAHRGRGAGIARRQPSDRGQRHLAAARRRRRRGSRADDAASRSAASRCSSLPGSPCPSCSRARRRRAASSRASCTRPGSPTRADSRCVLAFVALVTLGRRRDAGRAGAQGRPRHVAGGRGQARGASRDGERDARGALPARGVAVAATATSSRGPRPAPRSPAASRTRSPARSACSRRRRRGCCCSGRVVTRGDGWRDDVRRVCSRRSSPRRSSECSCALGRSARFWPVVRGRPHRLDLRQRARRDARARGTPRQRRRELLVERASPGGGHRPARGWSRHEARARGPGSTSSDRSRCCRPRSGWSRARSSAAGAGRATVSRRPRGAPRGAADRSWPRRSTPRATS